mmetsp:Transcript_2621/g.3847  ORF Transcript_2621/g.3847 Transcript_2621/m.3847 type:complete len:902 (-) Transcript_2621:252-2957(-)
MCSMLRKLAIVLIGQAILAFGRVVNVGGLFDSTIVDMSTGEEGLRINRSLHMPPNNVKVTSITNVSMGDFAASPGVLEGLDVLFIPFQEISSLQARMSTADEGALADWVRAGKLLIVVGSDDFKSTDIDLLNSVFSYSLQKQTFCLTIGAMATLNSGAAALANTPFLTSSVPNPLPFVDRTCGLLLPSLPGNATAVYNLTTPPSPFPSQDTSYVTLFKEGIGFIIHLGFLFRQPSTDTPVGTFADIAKWDTIIATSLNFTQLLPTPTPPPTPRPPPMPVAILMDSLIVDNTNEALETNRSLHQTATKSNIQITSISTIAQGGIHGGLLDPFAAFVIPEQETSPILTRLSSNDQARLRAWVREGKLLIVHGGASNTNEIDLLNTVFGYSLTRLLSCTSSPTMTTKSTGEGLDNTPFDDPTLPSPLSALSFSCGLDELSLNVSIATPVYKSAGLVWVTLFREGQGYIVHMGFDFWRPPFDFFGEFAVIAQWDIVLAAAANLTQILPEPTPTSSPTATMTTKAPTVTRAPSLSDLRVLLYQNLSTLTRFNPNTVKQASTAVLSLPNVQVTNLTNWAPGDFAKRIVLDNVDVLVIPPMAIVPQLSMQRDLTEEDATALRAWIEEGHTLMTFGDSNTNYNFLVRQIIPTEFATPAVIGDLSSPSTKNLTNTLGTVYENSGCPSVLSSGPNLYGYEKLGTVQWKPIYDNGGKAYVAIRPTGFGWMVHHAYDFQSGPIPGWPCILNTAMTLARTVPALATDYPTRAPTVTTTPTIAPTANTTGPTAHPTSNPQTQTPTISPTLQPTTMAPSNVNARPEQTDQGTQTVVIIFALSGFGLAILVGGICFRYCNVKKFKKDRSTSVGGREANRDQHPDFEAKTSVQNIVSDRGSTAQIHGAPLGGSSMNLI